MHLLKLVVLPLLFLNMAFSQTKPHDEIDIDKKYGGGSEEFEFEKFDNETILLAIKRDMEVACNKQGLCTLSAVTSNDSRFTAQFNIGEGYNMGGYGGGSGTTVIVPGSGGYVNSPEPYYGVTLRYTKARCTQTIKVPRSLYFSINRYM